tara:strand:+ start:343 stop:540 length:198 start_codon:yes stop_codon:yes gene_type:complete
MYDKKQKELIKLVHVIALSALHQANPSNKTKVELEKYAFPLEINLADDVNYKQRSKRNYWGEVQK